MKRFLCTILTAALIFSLIPSVFAEETAAGEPVSVTYTIYGGGRNDISAGYSSNIQDKTGAWQALYKALPSNPANPGQNWAYLGTTLTTGWNDGVNVAITKDYVGGGFSRNENEWMAFKIKVPEDGRYYLSDFRAYCYHNATTDLDIYIFPMDETKFYEGSSIYGTITDGKRTGHTLFPDLGIENPTLLGNVNIYTTSENAGTKAVPVSVNASAVLSASQEYVVLLNNKISGKVITTAGLTLTKGDIPPQEVKLDFTEFDVTGATGETVEEYVKGSNWRTIPEESLLRPATANHYVVTATAAKREKFACVAIQNSYQEWTDNANSKWTVEVDLGTTTPAWYDISIEGAQLLNGCAAYIYVDGQYAGIYNTNGTVTESYGTLTSKNLNTVYITPDENGKAKIIIAYAGAGTLVSEVYISRMYLANILLTPNFAYTAPSFSEIVAEIPSEVTVGSSVSFEASAKMSDESTYHASEFNADHTKNADFGVNAELIDNAKGAFTLTATEGPGVYYRPEKDGNGNHTSFDGVYAGTLTAVRSGTATVKLTANVGGEVYTKLVTVTAPSNDGSVEVKEEANFSVLAEDGGSVEVLGNYEVVDKVAVGTRITATATPNDGYTFAYWRNADGSKVLSTNATETFAVNTNTSVIAVFTKDVTEEDTTVPVFFYNGNGELLESKTIERGVTFESVKIANPSLTGYAFSGWSIADGAILNGLTRAVALFEDSSETYTVKVGETPVFTGKKYGEEVTVTSGADNFAAWKLGDKVISYDKSFTFTVYGDIILTEVTGEAMEKAPVAVLDTVGGELFLTYSVPEGYTKLEAGILFAKSGKPEVGSFHSKAAEKTGSGQFTAKPYGDGDGIARGYIIYRDSYGDTRVVYSD
ncbi:MAG: hypothetical protein E7473_09400 [Ruminococcaceae bacterium]|nr:hypothetical protein [Oscillospiraceae bacterium]